MSVEEKFSEKRAGLKTPTKLEVEICAKTTENKQTFHIAWDCAVNLDFGIYWSVLI